MDRLFSVGGFFSLYSMVAESGLGGRSGYFFIWFGFFRVVLKSWFTFFLW